jgi:redox-sensitive bicupin YhaK (pirin superfamily)
MSSPMTTAAALRTRTTLEGVGSQQPKVDRAEDRFVTRAPGRVTRHSFSFGQHYDPANVGFGALVCLNDDLVEGGHGYAEHPHAGLEIVTWVLAGALRHADSTGHSGEVRPGQVQLLSAASGVRHAEVNASPREPVRFVQMWLRPDRPGGAPAYAQRQMGDELASGGWVTLASGLPRDRDRAAVALGRRGAALHACRPTATGITLPDAPATFVFVARGGVEVEGLGRLSTGDSVRLTDDGGRRLLRRGGDAEVLVWELW